MGADYRAKIGYMPQQQSLYEAFTAEKFLWYMAALKGMNRKDAREQIENLLEVVNLKEERYKKLKYFSGGMKQRILLAELEHKVYNVLVTEREGEEYQNSGARIISVTLTEKGHRLRIISADALKTGNVEEVYPCLEDVYLYWIDRE